MRFIMSSNKKAERLEMRAGEITRALANGYVKHERAGLDGVAISKEENGKFIFKSWKGSSANPHSHFYVTSQEKLNEQIEKFFDYLSRVAVRKSEPKQKTSAALCAKAIREELKKKFPKTKFKITSSTYSMGNSVRITYTDGPAKCYVDEIVRKYQEGSFDGMTDMYEYTNTRNDIPQAKYVQVSRDMSDEAGAKLAKTLKDRVFDSIHSESQTIYRLFSETSF